VSFYGDLNATATRLVQQFGTVVTLTTTISQGVVNERTPKVVFVEIVKGTATSFGDGGVIEGDWYVLMESSAAPIKGDVFRFDGLKYAVVFAEPIQPGGVVLTYKAWVRVA
jgi:hypothetical protein